LQYFAITNKYSSATAERPHELGDFKRVGHFEAKFTSKSFAPISMDR